MSYQNHYNLPAAPPMQMNPNSAFNMPQPTATAAVYYPQQAAAAETSNQQPPVTQQSLRSNEETANINAPLNSENAVDFSFSTGHSGVVHDAVPDYYGMFLATASADHTVKIWNTSDRMNPVLEDTLEKHQAAVMHVDWAHPKYGTLLATGGWDKKVYIWKREPNGKWNVVHAPEEMHGSVNALEFAPHELGLHLAVVTTGGYCTVLTMHGGQWISKDFQVGTPGMGATALSWAPTVKAALLASGPLVSQQTNLSPMRLVISSADSSVHLFELDSSRDQWLEDPAFKSLAENTDGHKDWVWDVAWRPHIGIPTSILASASQDKTVIIWSQGNENANWTVAQIIELHEPCFRVSWSFTGSVLAVAHGSNNVTMFQETSDSHFEKISQEEN